ncbi:MAG: hypothetical protein AABZ63_06895, partial [Actinomycetota bacterium]
VTASSVSCPVTGLAVGSHTIGGSVSDIAGNTATISGSFTVATSTDTTPPRKRGNSHWWDDGWVEQDR